MPLPPPLSRCCPWKPLLKSPWTACGSPDLSWPSWPVSPNRLWVAPPAVAATASRWSADLLGSKKSHRVCPLSQRSVGQLTLCDGTCWQCIVADPATTSMVLYRLTPSLIHSYYPEMIVVNLFTVTSFDVSLREGLCCWLCNYSFLLRNWLLHTLWSSVEKMFNITRSFPLEFRPPSMTQTHEY